MKNTKYVVLLYALFLSQQAMAQNLTCYGFLSHVWVDDSNQLYIAASYRGDHTMICDLDNDWKGITPAVCENWFDIARSILALDRYTSFVTVRYLDTPYANCSELPLYSESPAPLYVMHQRR